MNNLIDGIKVASEIKDEITKKISFSISKGNRAPSIKLFWSELMVPVEFM